VGSCPVGGENAGCSRFSRFCPHIGHYSDYSPEVNQAPASIIDLLYTSGALEGVGSGRKPYIVHN
jgi:hypothetical protein